MINDMYDLKITDGLVFDGNSRDGIKTNVAVKDGIFLRSAAIMWSWLLQNTALGATRKLPKGSHFLTRIGLTVV